MQKDQQVKRPDTENGNDYFTERRNLKNANAISGITIDRSYCFLQQSVFTQILGTGRSLSLAAVAAQSLQSCLTLCNPIDSSTPGSSVPGILQARILEWVAISFSNACMHAKSLQSCPTLCNPMDSSSPGSSVHGILYTRILEWVAISFS